jgi:hypothetical protein
MAMALLHNVRDGTTHRESPNRHCFFTPWNRPSLFGGRTVRVRLGVAVLARLVTAVCWSAVVAAASTTTAAPRKFEQQEAGRAVLDLSRKETYQVLEVNADPEQIVIENVEVDELPAKHRLVPKSGSARIGQPLDIQLEQPNNVRIRLALVKRGNDVAVRISPQIVISEHNTIELTRDRIARTTRKFFRRVKDLNQQLAALAAERQALSVWLISPGNKPLSAVKEANFRIKMLNQAIRACQREVPRVQSQCAALGQATAFIKKLHKTVEIRYEVRVERDERDES